MTPTSPRIGSGFISPCLVFNSASKIGSKMAKWQNSKIAKWQNSKNGKMAHAPW
jgi:hypothetical protein